MRIVCLSFLAVAMIFWGPVLTGAAPVPVNDLIEKSREYDGKRVTISGEAIGDVMKRGTFAWVNVADSSAAIGVWLPYKEAKKITHTGSYRFRGDTVLVEGVFHRACPEHYGELDLHVNTLQIVSRGRPLFHPLDREKALLAGILLLLTAAVAMVWYRRKKAGLL